jgi:CheY-like chemotaxis protein
VTDLSAKPQCVLIIDDSEVVLDTARIILEEAGYRVVTLDNPLVMGKAVRTESPDLVLIDVNMPALTGDHVVEIARRHGLTGHIPVVLHSDMPVSDLEERARRCGASGFIQKTSDEAKFLEQVRQWLKPRDHSEP